MITIKSMTPAQALEEIDSQMAKCLDRLDGIDHYINHEEDGDPITEEGWEVLMQDIDETNARIKVLNQMRKHVEAIARRYT